MDLKRASQYTHLGQLARERQRRTGLSPFGLRIWSLEEDDFVRALYPDYKALMGALPTRTNGAIRARAQVLGITKKRKTWSGKNASILRRNFSAQTWETLQELLPGFTRKEIASYARTMLGLRRRGQQHSVSSGHPPIDAIRARAKELNLSMSDVDKMARTKKYFQMHQWRSAAGLNGRAVVRAVEALDGHIEVVWH